MGGGHGILRLSPQATSRRCSAANRSCFSRSFEAPGERFSAEFSQAFAKSLLPRSRGRRDLATLSNRNEVVVIQQSLDEQRTGIVDHRT